MHSNFKDRTGETSTSNEGYSLKIVAYRNCEDVDVLVDGKHIREGVTYDSFKKGSISLVSKKRDVTAERVGEKSFNNQGLPMEIVAYRSSTDIDVLVDGKYLREGVKYGKFKSGGLSYQKGLKVFAGGRFGEKAMSCAGYSLEIVAYRSCMDIDVLVDGKYLHEHISYGAFKSGRISCSDLKASTIKSSRIGEKSVNKAGYSLEIVAYRSRMDIDVLVDGRYLRENVPYKRFKAGSIALLSRAAVVKKRMCVPVKEELPQAKKKKLDARSPDPYTKNFCGVGYTGVGKYVKSLNGVTTQVYRKWSGMLSRCYGNYTKSKYPSYVGCIVCDEWHNFQVFAQWYMDNIYAVSSETIELDKDILIKGNKVYSAETCVFVPQFINSLLLSSSRSRGSLPIGVSKTVYNTYNARTTTSRAGQKSVLKNLGSFKTPDEAFEAYKTAKETYIKQVADEYKDKIPKRLYDALYAYTIEITD